MPYRQTAGESYALNGDEGLGLPTGIRKKAFVSNDYIAGEMNLALTIYWRSCGRLSSRTP